MKKYFISILSLIFFNTLSAEIVKKIEISGNDRYSKETIIVYGDIKINNDYSSADLNKILKDLYSTNFFKTINIDLENNILKINVNEHEIINDISITGEKAKKIKDVIFKSIQLKKNNAFIKSYLSEDVDAMKNLYASLGYNFAKIETKIERFTGNRLNLEFTVVRGEKTKIKNIYFIGDKKVKYTTLRDIIVSQEHKFWKFLSSSTNLNNQNIELDKRLLENYYKSIGYYDVKIISTNAEISTNVKQPLDKTLFSSLDKEYIKIVGKYYSPFLVTKLLDRLDLLINDKELQFVEHSVNESIEGDSIEIKINVYEGKKQLIERINIKGNTVTNEEVIRSELFLDEGDPFSPQKFQKSILNLKARNLFGEVNSEIKDGTSSDLKIINVTVEEKPTGEISAGAGIGTSGGSFSFKVSENNWLGKGLKVSTFIDAKKESLKGAFTVSDPNFRYSGNSLDYFISNTKTDSKTSGYENTLIATGLGTSFEQYQDTFISPAISLRLDDLKVNATGSAGLKKQAGNFTELAFDYGVAVDKRNSPYKPTDGYFSKFKQGIPLYADSPFIQNTYQFSAYKAFSADLIGSIKFYGSAINGLDDKDVRISKRIKLSQNKIRGFEQGKIGPKDGDDFIGGNYATAVNFETSLPNLLPEYTKTDIGLFLDLGNVWSIDYDSSLEDTNKIRSTAGLAADWSSPLGPMSFILSQNITKASTDVTETFNFRLGTRF
jgi:outer membrane protein insertion porin family